MPNAFQSAIRNAQRTVARHAGLRVRYESGDHRVEQLRATPAAVSAEVLVEEDLGVRALSQDWLVDRDQLRYQGQRQKPAAGDRLVLLDDADGARRVYEVVALGGGSHYEPADPYGLQWRIHSKLIQGGI